MLPFCDRTIHVARQNVRPIWTRSFPANKQPQTIGEHLRKKRFGLGWRQIEAARQLRVSERTLGLWECDRVFPTWPFQPRIVHYLGYDPFTKPELGGPKINETTYVAILSSNGSVPIGVQLRKHRLKLRKNKKEFASQLGVSVKTLRGWEMNRCRPCKNHRERISRFLS